MLTSITFSGSYAISLWIVSAIVILSLTYRICKLLYSYERINHLKHSTMELSYITKLLPWIHKQIELSVAKIIQENVGAPTAEKITKTITIDQYNKLIQDIRTHFYGSVPIIICNSMIQDKHVDTRQIDILILNEFAKQNDIFNIVMSLEEGDRS